MTFAPDLDAYFLRLEDSGPRRPTLETLNRVLAAHIQHIPFENLDILLGLPISNDPAAIEAKLVHARRGGYCFEQNVLLLHVLRALGFEVTPLSARVRLKQPRSFTPPRTHLFLRVEIDGTSYLADAGVGGLSPTKALRLELDSIQTTPHEPRRIIATGQWSGFGSRGPEARLYHQARLGESWEDVCEFTLEEMPDIDVLLASWFIGAHADSHFRQRLVVARAEGDTRLTLLNREFKRRLRNGQTESTLVNTPEQLLRLLREQFSLQFEPGTCFDCAGLAWQTA